MFNITGARRRRFINFVNRNLERALAVNTPIEGRVENNVQEEYQEEDIVLINEEQERQLRRVEKLHRILLAIPRALRNRVENSDLVQRLKEAVAGLRIDQIPEAVMETLNDFI